MARPNESDRDRLIRFIQPWIDARPRQYAMHVGAYGCGYPLKPADLSDDALENLASLIRRNFWRERRSNRENRALWAAHTRMRSTVLSAEPGPDLPIHPITQDVETRV